MSRTLVVLSLVFAVVLARASTPAGDDPFCTASPQERSFMSPGTLRMASRLEQLARASNPIKNGFVNSTRVALLKAEIARAPSNAVPISLQTQLALDLLYAGQSAEASEEFNKLHALASARESDFGLQFLLDLGHLRAVAHLRMGEEQNCLTNHNAQSCIFPIESGGVHRIQTGSRRAIDLLQEQLKRFPRDGSAVWLLNLAYMTLGEYPDKVPAQWQIPARVFASEYPLPAFNDIAGKVGLDVDDLAGGTIAEDFDNDGDLDLLMSDWSLRGPMHYFSRNPDGTFSDRTMQAGLATLPGGLHIVQGDYNNDGLADVLVLRGAWLEGEGCLPDSLLRNDGQGHFTDVTEEARLLTFAPGQTAAWLDFDGDGWLDLYFGYESTGTNIFPCKLYRNNQDGTFQDVAQHSGAAVAGFVKGVAAGDYNNDGRPDIYLSMRDKPNVLLRNDGPGKETNSWRFSDVTQAAGVAAPTNSFATWFFDYDNDGWEDLFVCGYGLNSIGEVAQDYLGLPHGAERPRLYRNNRDGSFKDVTKEAGMYRLVHGMGSNYGDFDNDGWLDMYLGTGDPNFENLMPNRAFRNAGGTRFQDVTTASRLGHLQKGHGVSFADFDQDGDQDIYHSVGGAYEGDHYRNALFENPGNGNSWLVLKFEGVRANKPGLGSRIKLTVSDSGSDRTIARTVSTGSSFGSNPLRQMIGLGKASLIKSLEIKWAGSGTSQIFTNLTANKFYKVIEGSDRLMELPYPALPFKAGADLAHRHISLR